MNWYRRSKISQFVDFQAIVQSIVQRLIQAEQGNPAGENAADDIHSQGYDQPTIENALQQAIFMVAGSQGEMALSEPQRHVVMTIRGGQMQPSQAPTPPMEGGNGIGQGVQLNSV